MAPTGDLYQRATTMTLAGTVVEVLVLVTLTFVPPLRHVFGLAPLGLAEWTPLLAFPAIVLGREESRKWFSRQRRPSVGRHAGSVAVERLESPITCHRKNRTGSR